MTLPARGGRRERRKADGDRGLSRDRCAWARIPASGRRRRSGSSVCTCPRFCVRSIERRLGWEANVLDGQRGPQPIRFRSARYLSSTGWRESLRSDSRPGGRLLVSMSAEDKERSNELFQAGCDKFLSRRPSHSVFADMLRRRRCGEEVSGVKRCRHCIGHTRLRWKTLPFCGTRRRARFCNRRRSTAPAHARVGQGVRVS